MTQLQNVALVLKKWPLKGKNLLYTFLSNKGTQFQALYYYKKEMIAPELGEILELSFTERSYGENKLASLKELNLLWRPLKCRKSYGRYELLCSLLELVSLQQSSSHQRDFFVLLVSALAYLEERMDYPEEEDSFRALFLAKFLGTSGLSPQIDNCYLCKKKIDERESVLFSFEQGSLSCLNHHQHFSLQEKEIHQLIYLLFSSWGKLSFDEGMERLTQNNNLNLLTKYLWRYLSYQLNLSEGQLSLWQRSSEPNRESLPRSTV